MTQFTSGVVLADHNWTALNTGVTRVQNVLILEKWSNHSHSECDIHNIHTTFMPPSPHICVYRICTTPIPEKLGHFVKCNKICDLFILFNFYLIDNSTKKGFPKFSMTNVNVFCTKVKHIQLRFPALPYICCDFSGFPESFHNIMYGTWWKT